MIARALTGFMSIVRFAMHQDNEPAPFLERISAHFRTWLATQGCHSRESGNPEPCTPERIRWLQMIRDHIAANLGIEPHDFEYALCSPRGGLGKVHQLFGDELSAVIDELNGTLAA